MVRLSTRADQVAEFAVSSNSFKGNRSTGSSASYLHSNELVLRELFRELDGKTSGPGSFTELLGKAASGSVHRLTPVKFSPVSVPAELALPDSVIADLSSDQLLLYQLYRALQTGNIAPKETCEKIGPMNHAR